ncbi:LysR family transcriptional regulator [Ectothiorhodospiraceae bacterium WFHF3C12]|nr:LysR family transcriptional regulator [Ectothiorhodospiraceae bacterium WFHF3C12]
MIEIRHLETLRALREHGSLSGAAAQLGFTASALSHQLLTLEERLGAELFLRKTRPVQFTRAGKRLLELAERVLPLVGEAERDISRLSGRLAGRLHIAIECHSCYQWLMPTLDRYRQDWPEVELDLTAGFNFDALPALRRGELDLVVTSDPEDSREIIYHPLFRHEAVFAVGRAHRLAGHRRILPEDLRGETLVTYPVERSRLDVFRAFLEPAGVEPAEVRTAELTVMILQLVASGRGVAMLPNWALTELGGSDAVVGIPVGPERKYGTLYAAVRRENNDAPYIQDFLAMAREVSFQTLEGISPATA